MNQKISYDANVSLSAIVYAIEEDIRRQKEEEEREKRNKMAALKLRNNNSDVNAVNKKQRRSVRKKLYCTQFLEKVIDFNNKSSTGKTMFFLRKETSFRSRFISLNC